MNMVAAINPRLRVGLEVRVYSTGKTMNAACDRLHAKCCSARPSRYVGAAIATMVPNIRYCDEDRWDRLIIWFSKESIQEDRVIIHEANHTSRYLLSCVTAPYKKDLRIKPPRGYGYGEMKDVWIEELECNYHTALLDYLMRWREVGHPNLLSEEHARELNLPNPFELYDPFRNKFLA